MEENFCGPTAAELPTGLSIDSSRSAPACPGRLRITEFWIRQEFASQASAHELQIIDAFACAISAVRACTYIGNEYVRMLKSGCGQKLAPVISSVNARNRLPWRAANGSGFAGSNRRAMQAGPGSNRLDAIGVWVCERPRFR